MNYKTFSPLALATRLIVLLLLVSSLTGCLRYVPSRAEIDSSGRSDDSVLVQSEEEFFKHERLQEAELNQLLQRRQTSAGIQGNPSYKIGIGDQIQVEVFDVPEMNRQVRVRPGGQISLPLVESIQAAGKTEPELQEIISKKLENFLVNPQVSVFLTEYAAHRVSVIGEVAKPGVYPLKRDDYTLLEVISEAGGKTVRSGGYIVLVPAKERNSQARGSLSSDEALVIDEGATGETVSSGYVGNSFGIEIPFDDITGSADKRPVNLVLRPGDTVIVPEAGKVQVDGEVNRSGSYELGGRMTLLGALAAAGSVNYSADVNKVEVIREISPGKKAVLQVDVEQLALGGGKDLRLRDGDVVRVPSASGRFVTRQIVTAITGAVNFGVGGNFNAGP